MSEMRQLLLDTAVRLFEAASDDEVFEAVEEGRFPESHWRTIEDNGLVDMLLPEEDGGAGADFGDAMAVARTAGAFALPLPLVETMIGRWLLSGAGLEAPAGPLGMVTAAGRPEVPWPDNISALVVSGATGGVGWVAAGEVEFERATNSAGEPVGRLREPPPIPPGQSGDLSSEPSPSTVMAVARSAMIAGAMERILDLTIEHVQGRVQFGRPLARFQAVQQLVAVMASHTAVVGVAADTAIAAVETVLDRDGGDPTLMAGCAKARASEACYEVTRIAHQLHGAIGYTREHDLHRFTRRLWAWRDADGDEGYWQQRVGEMAIRSGGAGLWPLLVEARSAALER
ncbi:MAG: acyl-CoA/acyl-ACP dehydrogenase [Acidobacteria bacterium]|nr:acyl-CoA/acyl-ACP dehydrogenase [Acidobacteriota bacterium]MCY3934329.1 acyl-CoA/acyl-ACP dehydrogenase [Acidobacteriota bacterium]